MSSPNDPAVKTASTITGSAQLVKYWPAPLKEDMVVYVGHWMQFLPARITKVVAGSDWRMPELTIALDKDLVFPPDAKVSPQLSRRRQAPGSRDADDCIKSIILFFRFRYAGPARFNPATGNF